MVEETEFGDMKPIGISEQVVPKVKVSGYREHKDDKLSEAFNWDAGIELAVNSMYDYANVMLSLDEAAELIEALKISIEYAKSEDKE